MNSKPKWKYENENVLIFVVLVDLILVLLSLIIKEWLFYTLAFAVVFHVFIARYFVLRYLIYSGLPNGSKQQWYIDFTSGNRNISKSKKIRKKERERKIQRIRRIRRERERERKRILAWKQKLKKKLRSTTTLPLQECLFLAGPYFREQDRKNKRKILDIVMFAHRYLRLRIEIIASNIARSSSFFL
jgi:hypothetical protein